MARKATTKVSASAVKQTIAGTKSAAATKMVEMKKASTKKRPASDDEDFENDSPVEKEDNKQPTKKRKKAGKKDDSVALAERTPISSLSKPMYLGAHVSAAGGVQNSIPAATNIGANAFALFLKSQRKWTSPPLAADAKAEFLSMCKSHGFDAAKHCLPHGSYLVNLAQKDKTKADQAYDNFVDDLQRCESLGVRLYNFHPGSTGGEPRAEAIGRIAAQLNRAHAATSTVVTVLENMAGSKAGTVIGERFEDLRDIIAGVRDKARVGVCIDTCHAFAAGYDLRTPAAFAKTMAEFDRVVGLGYLRALHLNDSKGPLGSHRDLHANIGTGCLGLAAFHCVVNYEPFQGLPMVLETPIDRKGPDGKSFEDRQVWADEIKLLENLIGVDLEGDEFKAKERELQGQGVGERDRIQGQVDKGAKKTAKKASKPTKRKKKAAESSDDDEESD